MQSKTGTSQPARPEHTTKPTVAAAHQTMSANYIPKYAKMGSLQHVARPSGTIQYNTCLMGRICSIVANRVRHLHICFSKLLVHTVWVGQSFFEPTLLTGKPRLRIHQVQSYANTHLQGSLLSTTQQTDMQGATVTAESAAQIA